MKIDKLEIKNFKFFDEVEPLDFDGKNILVYGENGSGKSTIYWALYTLLQSSIKDDIKIKEYFSHPTNTILNNSSLVNIYADDNDSKIELFLKESEEEFIISKNMITIKTNEVIKKSLYTSDFINYKYLFRFFNFFHRDKIDLFNLFEYEILHFLNDSDSNTNLYDLWKEIINLEKDKPNQSSDKKENYSKLINKIDNFNQYLKIIIQNLNDPTNRYLRDAFSFNNLKLQLSIKEGKYQRENNRLPYIFHKPKINIELFILKDEINETILRPQSYFNEAKLTAIALSVRLAITQIKLKDSQLKLLVLDDLLVSLDMSNRDKVLDILLNDENLRDYQKIILTHDRSFFEMAKQKFNYIQRRKWKYFEMYVDIDDEKEIEIPYIKTDGQVYENLQRAKKHFQNKDYPASANYLRKEVERLFDEYLQINNLEEKIKLSKLKENEQLIWDIQKDLKKVLKVLEQFKNCERMPDGIQAQKCKEFSQQVICSIESICQYIYDDFHFEEFEDVKMVLKNILHPQSHNDSTRPLYKRELERAIDLLDAFNRIFI